MKDAFAEVGALAGIMGGVTGAFAPYTSGTYEVRSLPGVRVTLA